jgi:hypothetical protein
MEMWDHVKMRIAVKNRLTKHKYDFKNETKLSCPEIAKKLCHCHLIGIFTLTRIRTLKILNLFCIHLISSIDL